MKPTYPEKLVQRFLDERNIKYVLHDRSLLINPTTKRKLELDFYLPELKMGIEVQSKYHFYAAQRKRDAIKRRLCQSKGIELFLIFAPITRNKLKQLERAWKRRKENTNHLQLRTVD